MGMQFVNDTSRVVYAYEMPPCPAVLEESTDPPLVLDFSSLQEESNQYSATQTSSGKLKIGRILIRYSIFR